MNEEPASASLPSSSEPSSASPSPEQQPGATATEPPDPLLDKILGGIASALQSLTALAIENRKRLVAQDKRQAGQDELLAAYARRTDRRLSDLQVAFLSFAEASVAEQKLGTGVLTKAQEALEASRKKFEESGEHGKIDGPAPRVAVELAARLVHLAWPHVIKISIAILITAGAAAWVAVAPWLRESVQAIRSGWGW